MSSQPSARLMRRTSSADLEPDERRGWLSHGLAALAISALGLAVAGSVALTTNAQTASVGSPGLQRAASSALTVNPATGTYVKAAPVAKTPQGLRVFSRRDATAAGSSRSDVHSAVVHERAAQRAEILSKTAESVTRAAQAKSTQSRSNTLVKSDQATQAAAVKIARERMRRAVVARVAAEVARKKAEAAEAARKKAAAEAAANAKAAADAQTATDAEAATKAEAAAKDAAANAAAAARAADAADANTAKVERSTLRRSVTSTPKRSRSTQTTRRADSGDIFTSGRAVSPVSGAVIGSYFGQYGVWSRYHTGLDFRAAYGVPIRAVKAGVVLTAGNVGDWSGNRVAIKHRDGKTTMSSHMSSMRVSTGQSVEAGQVIGYVGQTGRAFGAHLHFELYPAGVRYGDVYRAINPQPWLSASGVSTR